MTKTIINKIGNNPVCTGTKNKTCDNCKSICCKLSKYYKAPDMLELLRMCAEHFRRIEYGGTDKVAESGRSIGVDILNLLTEIKGS